MKRILWALPICLAASQPVQADDTTSGLLGFLAGGAGSGKTELGDSAGQIEAWAIASHTATNASKAVWSTFAKDHASANVLIVDTSAKFSLAPYWLVLDRTKSMKGLLKEAWSATKCGNVTWAAATAGAADTGSGPTITDIAGLLRSDKKYDDIIIAPTVAFWLNALADESGRHGLKFDGKAFTLNGNVYLLPSLSPNPSAKVVTDWTALVDRTKRDIAVCTAGAKEGDKKFAAILALGDAISETNKTFMAAEKDAQSILEQASQLEPLVTDSTSSKRELLILRTNLEKVGATVVTTKNLLTMFGLPAVTLSGGLIGTFSVDQVAIEPRGPSKLVTSGNIACTGPRRPLGKWHGASLQANECFINGVQVTLPAPSDPAHSQ